MILFTLETTTYLILFRFFSSHFCHFLDTSSLYKNFDILHKQNMRLALGTALRKICLYFCSVPIVWQANQMGFHFSFLFGVNSTSKQQPIDPLLFFAKPFEHENRQMANFSFLRRSYGSNICGFWPIFFHLTRNFFSYLFCSFLALYTIFRRLLFIIWLTCQSICDNVFIEYEKEML